MRDQMNRSSVAAAEPLADITALVRERHDTGADGDCHLTVAPDVLDLMRALPKPPKPPGFSPGGLGSLLGLPIVLDQDLPPGAWQLVQRNIGPAPDYASSRTVLKEGTIA